MAQTGQSTGNSPVVEAPAPADKPFVDSDNYDLMGDPNWYAKDNNPEPVSGSGLTDSTTSKKPRLSPKQLVSQLLQELRNSETNAQDSSDGVVLTAGGVSRAPGRMPVMVKNENWDAALNMAADPLGIVQPLQELSAALREVNNAVAKSTFEKTRQSLIDMGVKDVPDFERTLGENGRAGIDWKGSMQRLADTYEAHIRDQRLRETWGDDYASIRLGKSRMTVQEFENRSLSLQQRTLNDAAQDGWKKLTNG